VSNKNKVETEHGAWSKRLDRLLGSAPWMKPREKKHYRAKVFRSGNSLALRLPAGLNLSAGMEMDLAVEDGVFFSFEPLNPPKRKFNIAKVAGSAANLEFLSEEDRVFDERPLLWDGPLDRDKRDE